MRNTIDPKATRPLTDAERAALSRYLTPTTYVIINDQIKALAQKITGGETNPVLAARKIYDWTLQNIDYWVKDPDRLKASTGEAQSIAWARKRATAPTSIPCLRRSRWPRASRRE